MAARDRADAVVVGAGVSGLTSAISLAEAGLDVRVVASLPPQQTVSALATAMIGPTFGMEGERVTAWERHTVEVMEGLAADGVPGVHLCDGRFISSFPGMIPPSADELPRFRLCDPGELPEGFESGFWAQVPIVHMPPYLDYLEQRLLSLGGQVVLGPAIASLQGVAGLGATIVNCTGLAARELASDPSVVPVRGPKVVVRNPGLDTFLIVGPPGPERTSYHPHGAVVVLGGSAVESDDPTPDPEEAAAIIGRCAAIEPRLAGAEVIFHAVGLRPGRPTIRLEADVVGATRCVHNYGHGGIGVTTAWGCAREVTALVTAS